MKQILRFPAAPLPLPSPKVLDCPWPSPPLPPIPEPEVFSCLDLPPAPPPSQEPEPRVVFPIRLLYRALQSAVWFHFENSMDAEEELVGGEVLVSGGNPKACYINYKVHTLKKQGRVMSFGQLNVQRQIFAREFDERVALQVRWTALFKE